MKVKALSFDEEDVPKGILEVKASFKGTIDVKVVSLSREAIVDVHE